jgi:hypothetical protein
MRTIYKYPLETGQFNDVSIRLPEGATIRRVAIQHNTPTLWAEIDTEAKLVVRHLRVHGTGHPIPAGAVYVGTWDDGPFVWHLYELPQ